MGRRRDGARARAGHRDTGIRRLRSTGNAPPGLSSHAASLAPLRFPLSPYLSLVPENLSGQGSRLLTVIHCHHTVDQHVLDTHRVSTGAGMCGRVRNVCGVEEA